MQCSVAAWFCLRLHTQQESCIFWCRFSVQLLGLFIGISVSFPRRSHQTVKSPVVALWISVVAASCSCAFPFYSLLGAPTLSRLLEAGPAQFTSPLASFSAVASEPPAKLLPPPVEPVSQATIVMMPTLSAPAVVPPAAAAESVATGASPTTHSELTSCWNAEPPVGSAPCELSAGLCHL